VRFTPGMQGFNIQINQRDTSYQQEKGQKLYDHFNRWEKTFEKVQPSVMIKSLNKTGFGAPAGSVSGVCNSWNQGHEFKLLLGPT